MNDENIFVTDREWFNPVNVIYEFKRLESLGVINPSIKPYKKLQEAYISAVSLIGMVSKLGLNFWLQMVDDKEGSPDIKTICRNPKGVVNEFAIHDVEVVIFNKHTPSDDLIEFLLKTKLSDNKAYDDLTNILCFIDRFVVFPSVFDIQQSLLAKDLKKKSPVMLLGKILKNEERYRLVHIYPEISFDITFDLLEECRKITYPGGFRLGRRGKMGEKPTYINDGSKICPFQKFGIE